MSHSGSNRWIPVGLLLSWLGLLLQAATAESFVHLTPFFPRLIHCWAVPRPL